MIFDIITIPNSNQAVIVDKTRVPNSESYCLWRSHAGWEISQYIHSEPSNENYFILASREPIPGVYLLPEWVWEKPRILSNDIIHEFVDKNCSTRHGKEVFASGAIWARDRYEAAGGYTRAQMLLFPDWLYGHGWKHYQEKDGQIMYQDLSQRNLPNKPIDELLEEFILATSRPRKLDITLNEDGSLPVDEKGVVKVNNVIY